MKWRLCVLLVGLAMSLPACAGGYYYPAYGYRPGYGQAYRAPAYAGYGYRPPVYENHGYARAYPNPGFHERRDFRPEGGRGWGGREERHEERERHGHG